MHLSFLTMLLTLFRVYPERTLPCSPTHLTTDDDRSVGSGGSAHIWTSQTDNGIIGREKPMWQGDKEAKIQNQKLGWDQRQEVTVSDRGHVSILLMYNIWYFVNIRTVNKTRDKKVLFDFLVCFISLQIPLCFLNTWHATVSNQAMLLYKISFSSERGLMLVTTVLGFCSYIYFRRCPYCICCSRREMQCRVLHYKTVHVNFCD